MPESWKMRRLMEDKYIPILRKVLRWWVPAVCLIVLWAGSVWAVGTPAGTPIAGTATASYTLGGDPTVLTATASSSFNVLEVINVALIWQDTANVPVDSPQTDRVLTFLLTNTGNGPETFRLTADGAVAGDQFNPAVQSIWIESNATPGLQAADTPYNPAGIALPADGSAVVYVTSTIPAGLADGAIGNVRLTAAALTPGAAGQAPGTLLPGAGYGSVDAVVGATRAQQDSSGSYAVATVSVTLSKGIARIVDLFGGDRPYTGARVTYRITVALSGSGTAEALVVSDPIPAGMTYVAGSLLLDGTGQTDAADTDPGDFNITAAGTVTVNFGDTAAPAAHTIEFNTTIN
jgi:uncharacterized repeat protein (TIGR01451 family)